MTTTADFLPPRRQPEFPREIARPRKEVMSSSGEVVITGLDRPGLDDDPEWYRTAVFYEVLVRAFTDSDGTGSGDIRGVIDRLDYLRWLGVDCLWLPPFYPSPLRDGGYDISDYTSIAPQYGTVEDFAELIDEAHARGMRIIVDLVMNHTSDEHPWFQASRNDPEGPYGDFYVWADTDEAYSDARIIFVDTERSNWTFDPVRRQYFWHRFFSHQPDLNFENPRVCDAMLDVARFWLGLGIDGFRLDAVPYLFEQEGTNCENLPRTHQFLAEVRAMVDMEYPGRITLAEANQWPQDVVEYFGTDEAPECHMCFHFPVMPRIFYALREQRARKILDIMEDTPAIPAQGGQWGTFLRNHDELTLEMVSTEERAAMYGWYATDPRMRANVGIRRRLAPLLENSLEEIHLAHALLLSLPGSPCLYYGDEIGMGDNIWLPDRDSVRTPMQWTPDRNAGFSTADPGKLYLPTIQSLVHHYEATNVEVALAQPHSLLHWVRGILNVRRLHPAFGRGTYAAVTASDPAILAYLREDRPAGVATGTSPRPAGAAAALPTPRHPAGDARGVASQDLTPASETILVAANLAATARRSVLTLPAHAGWDVKDVFGGASFGRVSETGELSLTFGSRDFYWLELVPPAEVPGEDEDDAARTGAGAADRSGGADRPGGAERGSSHGTHRPYINSHAAAFQASRPEKS